MDYSRLYYNITNKKSRIFLTDEYTEKHHIIPRCFGGLDTDHNLVELSLKEHFIAHLLLCKIYPENKKLLYAFNLMSKRAKINSNLYKSTREKFYKELSISAKQRIKDKGHPKGMKGKKHSTETKNKIRINSAHPQTEETKNKIREKHFNKSDLELKIISEKISKSKTGIPRSVETKSLLSKKMKEFYSNGHIHQSQGKTYDELYGPEKSLNLKEILSTSAKKRFKNKTYDELYGPEKSLELKEKRRKQKFGTKHSKETLEKLKGRKVSNETKEKLSNIKKDRIWVSKNKTSKQIEKCELIKYENNGYTLGRYIEYLTCPHCNISMDKSNIKRYHFDNCKQNL